MPLSRQLGGMPLKKGFSARVRLYILLQPEVIGDRRVSLDSLRTGPRFFVHGTFRAKLKHGDDLGLTSLKKKPDICALCYCSFLFVVFVLFFVLFFMLFSLELCSRCSYDLFPVQQTTYRIGNHVYITGYG